MLLRQPRPRAVLGGASPWLAHVFSVWVFFLVSAPALSTALQVTGLQDPQSFVGDPSSAYYFISNINGDPATRDNNGFITKLDGAGKIVERHFIQGGVDGTILHAPKGMAIIGRILYVADLETVRGFDLQTGRAAYTVSFVHHRGKTETTALADVAHDGNGLLYASDTEDDTIYRIDTTRDHAVSVLVRDDSLAGPRGLAVHPKTHHLIVASWHKGKILEVTPEGTITELVSNSFFFGRFHNLDGVDFDKWGNMYVSDFTAGKVWRMHPDGQFKVIAEHLQSPADISVDRSNHLILVPYFYANAAEINGLESPVKSKKRKRTLKDYGFGFRKPEPESSSP